GIYNFCYLHLEFHYFLRFILKEKSSPSDEFGFNLHAERSRGHFVGAVDKGGIGELAGLEMGQRIVGVNGSLIYPTTPHKEVVGLIKMNPLQTDLLVASEEVDRWYSENNQQFSFDYVDHYKHSSDSVRLPLFILYLFLGLFEACQKVIFAV
ncbi:unnamed protein product, partial [Toxocara canis]|uniref:PDZ domain-containing protein n=1 Tax=Toxocara canis TaxID=6265 RepID=A0A183TZG3_TOXCA